MAAVFGKPITKETLDAMPEYHGLDPKRKDRARVALLQKHCDGKDEKARQFVESFKRSYGGEYIMCLVYNATGGAVTFGAYKQWSGNTDTPYPMLIENGQWGAFMHWRTGPLAFTYSGKNERGRDTDWVFILTVDHNGLCYTEIRETGHYTFNSNWDQPLVSNMYQHDKHVHQARDIMGCSSLASIGSSGTCPFFEATMTLETALQRAIGFEEEGPYPN